MHDTAETPHAPHRQTWVSQELLFCCDQGGRRWATVTASRSRTSSAEIVEHVQCDQGFKAQVKHSGHDHVTRRRRVTKGKRCCGQARGQVGAHATSDNGTSRHGNGGSRWRNVGAELCAEQRAVWQGRRTSRLCKTMKDVTNDTTTSISVQAMILPKRSIERITTSFP